MPETRQSLRHRPIRWIRSCHLVLLAGFSLGALWGRAGLAQAAPEYPPLPNDAIPEPLTVEQAVTIGLQRNPATAAGIAGVAAAAGTYRSLAAFPPIELNVTGATGNTSAPTVNNLNSDVFIDVIGNLDTSGQRHYQAEGARAQLNATRYRFQESNLTLAQQIRDAYWTLVAAQAQNQIARQSLAEAQQVQQLTQTQLTAGEVPRMDVIRASIALASAQQSAVAAEGSEHAARVTFNALLARSPEAPAHLADTLTTASSPPALLPDLPPLP
ncbi:MAG TPA: TolC family protein, partial [Chthonomonadaceae bacterium]|nr:TolC family protein [Chthonomonadaceae bacterium]